MNPLEYIQDPLRWLLDFLHDEAGLTYGWAIVVLTVIVRMLLLPLVIKQYRSMRQLQAYSPQIKELQQKYKGNRAKQQEELMRFYRENQINPLASCLPIAAQLPIFIALYFVLRNFARSDALDGTDPSFMWVIPDISQRITEIGWGAAVVLGVYGVSQLLSTELSATPNMPDFQRRLFRIIPVVVIASFFLFENFPLPAGLVLYWATTNLWTAGQQLVMRHRIGLHLATPEVEARASGKRSSRTAPKEAVAAAVPDQPEEGSESASVAGSGDGEADAQPASDEGAVAVEAPPEEASDEATPADDGATNGQSDVPSSADQGSKAGRGAKSGASAGSPKGASRKRRPRGKGSGQARSGKRRAPRRKR